MTRLLRHTLINWIALLALLFGALAPVLSHAFVKAAPQAVEFPVCSAAGHSQDDANITGADPDANPFPHCPFCSDGHHAPGLQPQTPPALVAIGGHLLPSLFYQAPEPLFHWAATRSRAPPVLS